MLPFPLTGGFPPAYFSERKRKNLGRIISDQSTVANPPPPEKKIDSRGPETSTRVESRRALRRDPPMNNGSRALSVANFIQSIGYGGPEPPTVQPRRRRCRSVRRHVGAAQLNYATIAYVFRF